MLHIGGVGAMLRPARPGRFLEVHLPPDADIFAGLEPLADVGKLVRFVEVQRDAAVGERAGAVADQPGAPRRRERPRLLRQRPIGPRPPTCRLAARDAAREPALKSVVTVTWW